MSNSIHFNGVVEVNAKDAVASAYACICHIERARNEYFQEEIQKVIDDPPRMKWHYEGYKFNWRKPFKSYELPWDHLSMCKWIRASVEWPEYPKWIYYFEKHYGWCEEIIKMRGLNGTMFLTPNQANILHEFPVEKPKPNSLEQTIYGVIDNV